jgi:opacity protein-like surface antigen
MKWSLVACATFALGLTHASGAGAQDADRIRGYVHARVGGAFFPDKNLIGDVEMSTSQVGFGASLGVNLTRYIGVEVAVDGTETDVSFRGEGKFGEYAMWSVIPQLRVRYPLLGGSLVPYAIGGVGVAWTEFSDRTPLAEFISIRAKDTAVVGSIGAGIDYFVMSNVALGVETKYLIYGGQEFTIEGRESGKVHPNPLFVTFGIRVLFP